MGQLLFFGCSALVVRFLRFIGQLQDHALAACPIPPLYRTTSGPHACCLSDSSALSDNFRITRLLLVRFLCFIGQLQDHALAACPIPLLYRTTSCITLRVTF